MPGYSKQYSGVGRLDADAMYVFRVSHTFTHLGKKAQEINAHT